MPGVYPSVPPPSENEAHPPAREVIGLDRGGAATYASATADETDEFVRRLTIHRRNWVDDDAWWCRVEGLANELLPGGSIKYRRAQVLITNTRLHHIGHAMNK